MQNIETFIYSLTLMVKINIVISKLTLTLCSAVLDRSLSCSSSGSWIITSLSLLQKQSNKLIFKREFKICDNWQNAESVTFWHFQVDFLYPLVYFGPQPSQFPVCKKESINSRISLWINIKFNGKFIVSSEQDFTSKTFLLYTQWNT